MIRSRIFHPSAALRARIHAVGVGLLAVSYMLAGAAPLDADSSASLTLSDRDTSSPIERPRESLRLASRLQPAEPRQPPDAPSGDDSISRPESPAVPPESDVFRRQLLASFLQLRRAPAMFGDSFTGGALQVGGNGSSVVADLPQAGGNRRAKVAEHNKALAADRVYFLVNHFHNAREAVHARPPGSRSFDVNRYTIGLEKSFACGCWSAEIRMPFTGGADVYAVDPGNPTVTIFSASGGKIGDLAVILKRMLYQDEYRSVAAGFGVNAPTGSDVRAGTPSPATTYLVRNQAVNLLPYVGYLSAPNERVFSQAFAQLDFALNGHEVRAARAGAGTITGTLNEQTLLYLDVSAGYWLYSDPCRDWFPAIAAMVELHYTSTLQDADTFSAFGTFGNAANRLDVLNLTAGFHVEVTEATDLRLGGVFPIRDGDDRFFDSEITVSLIRHF